MKVILTGATGMVGKGVLYVCLEDPRITGVLSLSRSPLGMEHAKLTEVLHDNFMDWEGMDEVLSGYDACFFSLGVSVAGLSEAQYTQLTYDLTMGLARTLLKCNPAMQFCYVSGAGTDQSGRSRMMWSRVKGKTEKDLSALGFSKTWMFRPGFIVPKRGITSKVKWYQFFYDVLRPFFGLLEKMPKYVTNTDMVGRAMVNVCVEGYDRDILESADINLVGS